MGLKRDGVPLVPLRHPRVGTLMVEGTRTEEALGRDWCWGVLGCAGRTRRAGKGSQGEPEKISYKNKSQLLSKRPKNWNH